MVLPLYVYLPSYNCISHFLYTDILIDYRLDDYYMDLSNAVEEQREARFRNIELDASEQPAEVNAKSRFHDP